MKPGIRTYDVPIDIPRTTVGGTWNVIQVRVISPGRPLTLLPFNKCEFQIAPIPGILLPTRADVGISASQSQLLRKEAVRVQARIQKG